ncbi:MAG: amidohydrolase family protein [Oscillospiraceae bacterium]|nr:amidohydrolase family protein [Oscillospiraceae bacterium]
MEFDTLIRGARVLDGTGAPAFEADVGLAGGRIAAVGALSDVRAGTVIDAAGRCLTPGFIDLHRHADAALLRPGFGEAELAQGLTTVVNGNCGLSLAPVFGAHAEETAEYLAPIVGDISDELRFSTLGDYLDAARFRGCPINHAMLVGMGTLRTCVSGFENGDLDGEELRGLHRLLERALSDGALGVSLGLGYAPECFYSTAGLVRALEPLRGGTVPVAVHMRQEGEGVVDALREMLAVADELRIPLEVSHLKAIGRRGWRKNVPQMLSMIREARERGTDVACDVYPYTAGSTQLIHVLPPEFQKGGTAALTEALREPASRRAMRARMETGTDFENITHLVGFENVLATSLRQEENLAFEGLSLAEIADRAGKDPYDALFDLLASERCAPAMIDRISDAEDVAEILRSPFSCVISDATYPAVGLTHPRVYGAFARLIETWSREKHILSPETAVRKATLQAAERLGLKNKGRVAAGADADLCLFDWDALHEPGTFADPKQNAQGMDIVWVGGAVAFANGRMTQIRNGGIEKRQ